MPTATVGSGSPSFGPFTADLRSGELRRDGQKVPLQDKPFQVLALLVERPGELVTREELRERLWPADTFVDFDHGLNTAVKKLRQALDDSAESPRYVDTLARRGYRFIAPISPAGMRGAEAVAAPAVRRRRLGAAVAVALAATAPAAAVALSRRAPAPSVPGAPASLAVLPFANLGGHPDGEYLADGLTETLITELARLPGLLVIARNSVFQYKGKPVDLRRVGAELGVSHVLEGSVQQSGGQLRVSAQLVDAQTGYHVWAEKYDRPASDMFALQDEIAASVGRSLRLNLAGGRSSRGRPPTVSLEAYDAYLRGRFERQKLSRWWVAAIPHFERAVALDPQFALAHAALATSYVNRVFYEDPATAWEEKAYAEIAKALDLDPDLAEAYLARGNLTWTWPNRFPHERAIRDYQRALTLNPGLADAHVALGKLYGHVGLLDEALASLQTALRIDPTHAEAAARVAVTHLWQHRHAQVLSEIETIVGLQRGPYIKMAALSYSGRDAEAQALVPALLAKDPMDWRVLGFQAVILARTGHRQEAEALIARVAGAARNERGYSHYHHAQFHVGEAWAVLGEAERAVEWLQQAADEGFPCYPFYEKDPNFHRIRGHPAFQAFLGRLKQRWEGYRTAFGGAANEPAPVAAR